MEEGVKDKAAWEGEVWVGGEGEKKAGEEDAERGIHKQADRQTHAHTHTQAKVIQPAPPPDTQTNWR